MEYAVVWQHVMSSVCTVCCARCNNKNKNKHKHKLQFGVEASVLGFSCCIKNMG